MSYLTLAAAYRRVVEGLPRRAGWPIWLEVHNEPNLCYEWVCERGAIAGDRIGYEQVAGEYATFLRYFETELATIARPDLPVLQTETGRTTDGGGSREQIADWTTSAYADLWLADSRVLAVMPFMLRDASWDAFAWVATDGSHYPVYDAVRAQRCAIVFGRCP